MFNHFKSTLALKIPILSSLILNSESSMKLINYSKSLKVLKVTRKVITWTPWPKPLQIFDYIQLQHFHIDERETSNEKKSIHHLKMHFLTNFSNIKHKYSFSIIIHCHLHPRSQKFFSCKFFQLDLLTGMVKYRRMIIKQQKKKKIRQASQSCKHHLYIYLMIWVNILPALGTIPIKRRKRSLIFQLQCSLTICLGWLLLLQK